ncbi:LytTR family transcriptional regulator [Spirosoma sp. HMF4905]|uniref:LytTR family transcriptional regulator n=1 Tax=Spirosoma arboris TaxID=2682092 RepID=A0A7K1SQ83_9BACT|nr:LytTR family DNA-binding domain-containing protein [Spirosoma arboris]MVM35959.1 LytTR family transcriptional regulator [Spirosoma arboris]
MNDFVNSGPDFIKLPGLGKPFSVKAIIRLQGDGNYTWLYLSTQAAPVLIALTLKWFETHLPGFVRVHKSELINPLFIQSIDLFDASQLEICLLNNYKSKVSRRRIEPVLAKISGISLETDALMASW